MESPAAGRARLGGLLPGQLRRGPFRPPIRRCAPQRWHLLLHASLRGLASQATSAYHHVQIIPGPACLLALKAANCQACTAASERRAHTAATVVGFLVVLLAAVTRWACGVGGAGASGLLLVWLSETVGRKAQLLTSSARSQARLTHCSARTPAPRPQHPAPAAAATTRQGTRTRCGRWHFPMTGRSCTRGHGTAAYVPGGHRTAASCTCLRDTKALCWR